MYFFLKNNYLFMYRYIDKTLIKNVKNAKICKKKSVKFPIQDENWTAHPNTIHTPSISSLMVRFKVSYKEN